MANIRLSRQQVEVIGRLATQLRVGGQAVMVAGAAQNGKLRVHGVTLEYMTQLVPEQASNTIGPTETGIEQSVSVSVVWNRSAGNTIGIDDETPVLAGSIYNKSSESIIGPSANGIEQSVSLSVIRSLSAENTLILGQDVFQQETAGNTIGPTGNGIEQSVNVSVVRYPQVGNTLSLGQAMGTNQHMEEADNTLSLSYEIFATKVQFVTASSPLTMGQSLDIAFIKTTGSTLVLGQNVSVLIVKTLLAGNDIGINQTSFAISHPFTENVIGLNQSVTSQKIISRNITQALDIQQEPEAHGILRFLAGSALTGVEWTWIPLLGLQPLWVSLTDDVEMEHIIGERPTLASASSELNLGQSVSFSAIRHRGVGNTLNLKSTLGYIFIQDTTFCDYAPTVGSTTDPDAPEPPSMTPPVLAPGLYDGVELSYPVIAPTTILTLRGPELGNSNLINSQRVSRESRGGTLQVFRDKTWPQVQSMRFTFIGLTETEGQALLTLIEISVGKEVKLRDWEGREWFGIIISTNDPFTRVRDNCNLTIDMNFELTEGN